MGTMFMAAWVRILLFDFYVRTLTLEPSGSSLTLVCLTNTPDPRVLSLSLVCHTNTRDPQVPALTLVCHTNTRDPQVLPSL